VTGYVSTGRTATVKLYDVTAGAEAASISITATTQTAYTASVTKPGTARVYRVTFGVDGTLTTHTAVLNGAALKIGS
jgi:outer membrane lipopolysaccharide assembly protein LptE/RlpB